MKWHLEKIKIRLIMNYLIYTVNYELMHEWRKEKIMEKKIRAEIISIWLEISDTYKLMVPPPSLTAVQWWALRTISLGSDWTEIGEGLQTLWRINVQGLFRDKASKIRLLQIHRIVYLVYLKIHDLNLTHRAYTRPVLISIAIKITLLKL